LGFLPWDHVPHPRGGSAFRPRHVSELKK
jgi:hypothetical protein